MFEGAGFEVINVGIDVGPDAFTEAIKRDEPQVVSMSALLTTTMMNFKVVIDALERAGVRDKVKVLVGGAPVTQAYADSVGADGYAEDASRAVRKARELSGLPIYEWRPPSLTTGALARI
jgi:5-methyltetrahydrofolate--homocysteine methyltransferase